MRGIWGIVVPVNPIWGDVSLLLRREQGGGCRSCCRMGCGKFWGWRSVGAECLQTVIIKAMEDGDRIG